MIYASLFFFFHSVENIRKRLYQFRHLESNRLHTYKKSFHIKVVLMCVITDSFKRNYNICEDMSKQLCFCVWLVTAECFNWTQHMSIDCGSPLSIVELELLLHNEFALAQWAQRDLSKNVMSCHELRNLGYSILCEEILYMFTAPARLSREFGANSCLPTRKPKGYQIIRNLRRWHKGGRNPKSRFTIILVLAAKSVTNIYNLSDK
jgi:hypothetical protein